jgi:hypothetical protein
MAFKPMLWALSAPDLTSTEKLVLICIASFTDKHGHNAWPSIATIERLTSTSDRTIQRALAGLQSKDYLRWRASENRTGRVFQVNMRLLEARHGDGAPRHAVGGAKVTGATPWRGGGDTMTPNPPNDPSNILPLQPGENAELLPKPNLLAGFDEWWHEWGKKADKKAAKRAWVKIDPKHHQAIMMDTIARQLSGYFQGEAVLHPSTYLNGERWEDELTPAKQGDSHGKSAVERTPRASQKWADDELAKIRDRRAIDGDTDDT